MTPLYRLVQMSIVLSCLLVAGCSSLKRTLGIDRDAPNEFAVTPCTQPLDMPPDFFVLPRPCPGVPSYQETKAQHTKRQKLMGHKTEHGASSPGQTALLNIVGIQDTNPYIREHMDKEAHKDLSTPKNPVLKALGISQEKGDVIHPAKEAAALQQRGISLGN